MQPIFKEQIQMWHDCGGAPPIEEGTYWINNQVVKAFELGTGKLCNLYRMKVNDDLSISYKDHKDFNKHKNKVFETWSETAKRSSERIDVLECEAIKVLDNATKAYPSHERFVLTSTGKDSTVVEHICKIYDFKGRTVFNNTSLDVADTYKLAIESGYEITNPEEGFYQYIKRMNYIPSRTSRGCCTKFKEGCHAKWYSDTQKALWAMGVRNSESAGRSTYDYVGKNPKWENDWYSVCPILKWDDVDVWLYIIRENLRVNSKYKKGYQRVGCAIACPYYTKTTWALDRYWYPELYNRWHKILDNDFITGERWTKLNCTKKEYHSCWNGGLLRKTPTKAVVEEFANYKGIQDIHVAEKYFNEKCELCSDKSATKNLRQKEVVGMNLKIFGRDTKSFLCKKHLMEKFAWTEEDWGNQIADFKAQGCKLF